MGSLAAAVIAQSADRLPQQDDWIDDWEQDEAHWPAHQPIPDRAHTEMRSAALDNYSFIVDITRTGRHNKCHHYKKSYHFAVDFHCAPQAEPLCAKDQCQERQDAETWCT